jgi:RsmE family RNA methyltransferase
MNLILLHADEISPTGAARVIGARATHLVNVLDVTPGQQVRVGVIDGPIGHGTVITIDDGAVELQCQFGDVPPRPRVDLLLAVPRPKVLKRLWAQLAAVGVGHIMLTNAGRVERNYFDTHILEPYTFGPLLVEGLQQARDTRLPAVSIHRQFKILIEDHLDDLSPAGRRLAAHPGSSRSIRDALPGPADGGERVLLAVGPEGGWNDYELNLLEAHRFVVVGLGPRSLRTDTACIALLAIAHEALRADS